MQARSRALLQELGGHLSTCSHLTGEEAGLAREGPPPKIPRPRPQNRGRCTSQNPTLPSPSTQWCCLEGPGVNHQLIGAQRDTDSRTITEAHSREPLPYLKLRRQGPSDPCTQPSTWGRGVRGGLLCRWQGPSAARGRVAVAASSEPWQKCRFKVWMAPCSQRAARSTRNPRRF